MDRSSARIIRDLRIGVDLGGSKIEAVALAPDGRETLRKRVLTPRGDYAGTLAAVTSLVAEIGMPGTVSRLTGLVKNANSTWLIGRPLKEDLERALARPVRLENDANCFALSEAVDGAGAGARAVFGVILGTGVGGGIVVERQLLVGRNAIAGEWGHNPLPVPGPKDLPLPRCYCGRAGCIETYLSGPGLEREHRSLTGEERSAREVALADGEAMHRYIERLARSLAGVVNVLDPDVIVLGGGLSNIDRLYSDVRQLWTRYIFSDHVTTRLLRNVHGDSSGVRGAAWLWDAV